MDEPPASSFSLSISTEHLTRPATLLIQKISDAIGVLYQPTHIRKLAQAEADAALITANGEIAISDLQRRAMVRWVNEESQKQANIEAITGRTVPLLEQYAKPEQIDNDWIRNLFDKARHVSSPEMQELWAKVLARQANSENTISIHAVNVLASMDRQDAEFFTRVCQLVPRIDGKPYLIVMYDERDFDIEGGSNFHEILRLEELGLVRVQKGRGFDTAELPSQFVVEYGGRKGEILFTQHLRTAMVGETTFTSVGWQLFEAMPVAPTECVWDYLHNRWTKQSHIQIVSWDNW